MIKEITDSLYHNHLIEVGAERLDAYLPLLRGKTVGLVVNQTSTVGRTHLADTLISHDIKIVKNICPRTWVLGEQLTQVNRLKMELTPKQVYRFFSLYGKNKKPSAEQIEDLDILLFNGISDFELLQKLICNILIFFIIYKIHLFIIQVTYFILIIFVSISDYKYYPFLNYMKGQQEIQQHNY